MCNLRYLDYYLTAVLDVSQEGEKLYMNYYLQLVSFTWCSFHAKEPSN